MSVLTWARVSITAMAMAMAGCWSPIGTMQPHNHPGAPSGGSWGGETGYVDGSSDDGSADDGSPDGSEDGSSTDTGSDDGGSADDGSSDGADDGSSTDDGSDAGDEGGGCDDCWSSGWKKTFHQIEAREQALKVGRGAR